MVKSKKGGKWVLVLRKKDKKLSVLPQSSVKVGPKIGEQGKWASKWLPVKIILRGDDKAHLLSLRVDDDGKIINSGLPEESKIKKAEIDRRADAIIVHQTSIFDESASGSGAGNTKNLRKRVTTNQSMVNDDEGSEVTTEDEGTPNDDSDDEEIPSGESEENSSADEDEKDEWDNEVTPRTSRNRSKSPRLRDNCPFCAPEFKVTTEIASFVEQLATYLKCRYQSQSAAEVGGNSSLGESAGPSNTEAISTSNNRDNSKSSIVSDGIVVNSKLPIDGSVVELMEGSGVYVDSVKLSFFERKYLKKPGKLTTELFQAILGDNLSKMSLAGNCGHEKIPDLVRETVHDYVMTHKKKKKYNDNQFDQDVMKMCSKIRTAMKKAKETPVKMKPISKKLPQKKNQVPQTVQSENEQEIRDKSSLTTEAGQTTNQNSNKDSQNNQLPHGDSSSSTDTPSGKIDDIYLNAGNYQCSPPKIGEVPEPQSKISVPFSKEGVRDVVSHHPKPLEQNAKLVESMPVDLAAMNPEDSRIVEIEKDVRDTDPPRSSGRIGESSNIQANPEESLARSSSRSSSVSSGESQKESKSKRKHHKHRSKGRRGKDHGKREEKRHHHHAKKYEHRGSHHRHQDRKRKGRSSSGGSEKQKRRR